MAGRVVGRVAAAALAAVVAWSGAGARSRGSGPVEAAPLAPAGGAPGTVPAKPGGEPPAPRRPVGRPASAGTAFPGLARTGVRPAPTTAASGAWVAPRTGTRIAPGAPAPAGERAARRARSEPATRPAAASPAPPPAFAAEDISGEHGPQSEVSIAVNPQDPRDVVVGANDLAGSGVAAWWSLDGGASWHRVEMPLTDTLETGSDYTATDPSLAAGPDGTFYFSYSLVSGNGNDASIVVSRSLDGGRGWSVPAVVTPGILQHVDNDKDMLAVDTWSDPHRGYLYDVWDENPAQGQAQPVELAWSPPGGTHWSKPLTLNASGGSSGEGIYADATVAPDGTVYVVWDDYGLSNESSTLEVVRCAWSARGLDCGRPVAAASSFVNLDGPGPTLGNLPDCESEQTGNTTNPALQNMGWSCYAIPAQPHRGIAADPSLCAGPDGALHLVYDTATAPGAPNAEVMYAGSTDGGASWSTPREIDGDAASAYDFFPWVACDPATGALAVGFYSTRGDPTGRTVGEYLTWSLDGGTSWTPPVRVSGAPYDESGAAADSNDYGDYEGAAALRDVAYLGWTGDAPGLGEQVFAAGSVLPLAPGAPAGLESVAASPTADVITWMPVPGATSYAVYALPTGGAGPTAVPELLAEGLTEPRFLYRWTGPAQGDAVLVVRAADPAGAGPFSAPLAFPAPAPPGAPGALEAAPAAGGRIRFRWLPAAGAAGYVLYLDGRPWRRGIAGPPYLASGLAPATRYTFLLRAVNALGAGPPSPAAVVVTPPAAPAHLRAVREPGGAVHLTWEPARGATAYLVYRSEAGARGPFLLLAVVRGTALTDGSLGRAAGAWYRVAAVDGPSGPGAASAPARVGAAPAAPGARGGPARPPSPASRPARAAAGRRRSANR